MVSHYDIMPTADETLLLAIDAAMLALATGGAQSYSIAGRSFTHLQINDLRTWRNEVSSRIARAAGTQRPYVARFQEPR